MFFSRTMRVWAHSRSRTFLVALISFILGIGLHSTIGASHHWYPTALAIAGLFCFALVLRFWHRPLGRLVAITCLALVVGIARFDSVIPYGAPNEIGYYIGKEVSVRGVVAAAPIQRLAATLQEINVTSPGRGTLFLILPLSSRLVYGDEVSFSCAIRGTRGGRATLCNHPNDFTVLTHDKGQPAIAFLLKIKDRFARGLVHALPEPQASLAAGILYGDHTIPPRVAQDFAVTGVSHIIAASGYNVGMVAKALLIALLFLPFMNFRRAVIFLIIGTIAYVLISGASAAVVRAAIMAILVFIAGYLGRARRMTNVMVTAGALMLVVNPRLLLFDVGFMLSFAATIGIIFFAPALKKRHRKFFGAGDFWDAAAELFFATVGAVALTLPIILWVFGNVSLVSLPANLFIVFVVPFAMLASAMVGLVAVILPPAGSAIMWIAWAPLTYMLDVAHLFASIPRASFATGVWSRPLAILAAALVAYWIWKLYHVSKQKPATDDIAGWDIETV